ncbi:hypothetical protein Angca_003069, partial [Angiostrongylus cantonensis]
DFRIIDQTGCGEALEGVAVGADMYHVQKVRAFIGPYCNAGCAALQWIMKSLDWDEKGIRIDGKFLSNLRFADDIVIFSRSTSEAEMMINELSEAGVKIGLRINRKKTQFMKNQCNPSLLIITLQVMFDESSVAKSMMQRDLLNELANHARIIICIFSSTREMTKEFMKAIYNAEMNNHDYVYIIPWLQTEKKDASPWMGDDGQTQQNIKDHYANSFIVIDDVNGFDDTLVTPLREQVEASGMTMGDLDTSNTYGYTHLYDALQLYAIAVRNSINVTKNFTVHEDGRFVWNQMRRLTFPGLASAAGLSSGTVVMDDLAERAPVYAVFYVPPNSDTVRKVNEIEPKLIEKCDGLKTKTGCVDLQITEVVTGFWPSPDGALPQDEPSCGFRNERCDYTMLIIAGSMFLLLLFIIIGVFVTVRMCENRALAKMSWRIYRDDFRVVNEDEMRSMLSVGSSKTKLSKTSTFLKHHAVLGTNTHASFHVYPQCRPISFSRSDMQLLTLMKQSTHDNINPFLGMSFNEKDEMVLLWKFCSRGTIQDIIYNSEIVLDGKFHGAFVRDITSGLEYLHTSPIGYHGSLTPWACLIDRNWMIKLTDFGIASSLERWERKGLISTESLKEDDEDGKSGSLQKTSVLYQSPELLQNRAINRDRGAEQKWLKQVQSLRQMGDIYALGMVMYEILFRGIPFPSSIDIDELIENINSGENTCRPSIQDNSNVHPNLIALLSDCWSKNPEIRPSIRRVRINTRTYLEVTGSLVDQMMRMMEQYANNLEKLVQERTGMLEDANARADKLLSQLLPKYVANELKLGRSVPPRTFQSATVMFSDIVGFTAICASSTPIEVVNMLNTVYSKFDDVISINQAYKVETIGDAYMVVSGIPEENGTEHLMRISDTALQMMALLETFDIPHRRNSHVRIRVGYHSGTVAAGVVGHTAPRYCLFGDTVNMASRMESTGEPEKIQMSEFAHDMLYTYYPEYITELRGTVDVKGKGTCNTYWLLGKEECQSAKQ